VDEEIRRPFSVVWESMLETFEDEGLAPVRALALQAAPSPQFDIAVGEWIATVHDGRKRWEARAAAALVGGKYDPDAHRLSRTEELDRFSRDEAACGWLYSCSPDNRASCKASLRDTVLLRTHQYRRL